MLRRHLGWIAAACLLGLPLLGAPAKACCMVPFGYEGDVDQSGQDVVVLHHAGHEELILRVRPFFREAAEAPASLAWLVTVPSAPTAYKVTDPAIFTEARELHLHLEELYADQKPKPIGLPLGAKETTDGAVTRGAGGLEIDEQVRVGPYTITPVRARGAAAVDQLNRYLKSHGFSTEDPAHLAWFAANEFTFLCIKIRPPDGSVQLGRHLDLIPLQIGFEAEQPYYPGMYSANQGNFGLKLTLLTTRPVQRGALAAVGRRLRAQQGHGNLFTVLALPRLLAEAGAAAATGESTPERWYINGILSHGFNRIGADGRPAILGWTEDVTWTLGGEQDMPPAWYYGDGPKPLLHQDHLLLVGWVVLLAALALLLFYVLRRARRRRAA